MAGIDREEFNQWMQLLQQGQQGISARLDVLNGRTRENELAIAVLHERTSVQEARPSPKSAAVGAGWSAGAGAFVIGALEVAKWWFAK